MTDLKMLDCFCGLGGASSGFAKEGFDCTGIDIINVGYPYRFILADMLTLKGEDFRGYDVIWGSPPCRDFTRLPDHGEMRTGQHFKWKIPKNPANGLKLVNCFLQFVRNAKPQFWIMENVANLANYMQLKPQAINSKIWGGKRHVFYGNFPSFLIPTTRRLKVHEKYGGPLRSWERAKIPLACSLAFARACKDALLEKELFV